MRNRIDIGNRVAGEKGKKPDEFVTVSQLVDQYGNPFSQSANGDIAIRTPYIEDSKHLSSSDIYNWVTNPIELVAAPGVGKIIQSLQFGFKTTFVTTPYDTVPDIVICFDNDINLPICNVEYLGFNQSFNTWCEHFNNADYMFADEYGTLSLLENKNMAIAAGTAPTVGDGTFDIYFTYRIITL